ncbi:MAG: Virulence sensor protein BvgS [Pseudomonas fluorescens]|nr:MAG: Virulence sensor protein BvgS [Pseudomonas fluorescens]
MSHEIRTPISALVGLIEMLRVRGGTAEQMDENLKVAHLSAQSLLSLIGDILDLSKIEAGAMHPLHRPTHLIELLESVHTLFEVSAQNKHLAFELRIDTHDALVLIDSLMLNQIIANLISNAIKFTERGGVTLALKQLPDDAVSGFCRYLIEVRDTGVGLSETAKKAIFEPFVQVSPNTSGVRSTGLGLSICTRLAALLEARLSVTSTLGQGSCFQLEFAAERTRLAPATQPVQAPGPMNHCLNILVVEDHAPNRLLLCQQLEYLGHRVVPCHDGETALAEWKQADPPFDLTITDCNMPVMDGFELTRQMRSLEQARAMNPHPIFGLTAHAQSQVIEQCLEAGMSQCLFKPTGIETWAQHIGAASAEAARRASTVNTTSRELQKLKILSPDAYKPLVEQFISANREDRAGFKALMDMGDLKKIGTLTHKVKGGAVMAGAQGLVDACTQLETLLEQDTPGDYRAQVEQVVHVMQTLEQDLLAEIE